MAAAPDTLLTAPEVASFLKVSPKAVYRLVRQGLPGRRVGGEWRFVLREVLAWVEQGGTVAGAPGSSPPLSSGEGGPLPLPSPSLPLPSAGSAPPLLAANGDLVVEALLAAVNAAAPLVGFVQADRDAALSLLAASAVLAAGSHGKGPPARLGEVRLARLHLVSREVGLVGRPGPGRKAPRLADLARLRFATRPSSAGVIAHFVRAVEEARLDGRKLLGRAAPYPSHREVVFAVLRGDADAGLTTSAWAHRAGLPFRALAVESYGLLVRAADLGDPRVVKLCEVAQGAHYRQALSAIPGYDLDGSGDIRYDPDVA